MRRAVRDPNQAKYHKQFLSGKIRPVFWNLLTFILTAGLLLGGRALALGLGHWIPSGRDRVVRLQMQPVDLLSAPEQEAKDQVILPFDLMNSQNSRAVTPESLPDQQNYLIMLKLVAYLRGRMLGPEQYKDQENQVILHVFDAGGLDQAAFPEQAMLVLENRYQTGEGSAWTLRAAYDPGAGLTYLRVEAQQYLQGELKADESMLRQATRAADHFLLQLSDWMRVFIKSDQSFRVRMINRFPAEPSRLTTEGLICHVVYDDLAGEGSFIVFYNFATMQVVGFTSQIP